MMNIRICRTILTSPSAGQCQEFPDIPARHPKIWNMRANRGPDFMGFRYVRTFRTSLEPRDLEELGLLGNLGSLPPRGLSSAVPAIGQWSAQGCPDLTDVPDNPVSPDLPDFPESPETLGALDVRTSRFVLNLRVLLTFRQVRT